MNKPQTKRYSLRSVEAQARLELFLVCIKQELPAAVLAPVQSYRPGPPENGDAVEFPLEMMSDMRAALREDEAAAWGHLVRYAAKRNSQSDVDKLASILMLRLQHHYGDRGST